MPITNVPEFSRVDIQNMSTDELILLIPNVPVERNILIEALENELESRYQEQTVWSKVTTVDHDNSDPDKRYAYNREPPPGRGWERTGTPVFDNLSYPSLISVPWRRLKAFIDPVYDEEEAKKREDDEIAISNKVAEEPKPLSLWSILFESNKPL